MTVVGACAVVGAGAYDVDGSAVTIEVVGGSVVVVVAAVGRDVVA